MQRPPDFIAFLDSFRLEMSLSGLDPCRLDIDESGTQARLPGVRHEWFDIQRDHLDALGGSAEEQARAVFEVYVEDR